MKLRKYNCYVQILNEWPLPVFKNILKINKINAKIMVR
jgi:hypothetical protein